MSLEARPGASKPASQGAYLLEVLSDAANELCVVGYLATHLRAYGRRFHYAGNDMFWVRSEWCKFDLCFGAATARFTDWNQAWNDGTTGDLGCIEVKIIYEHFPDEKQLGLGDRLAGQLETNRRQTQAWRGTRRSSTLRKLEATYHGMIFYVGTASSAPPTHLPRAEAGLVQCGVWRKVATFSAAELESLWPRSDLRAGLSLQVGLFSR